MKQFISLVFLLAIILMSGCMSSKNTYCITFNDGNNETSVYIEENKLLEKKEPVKKGYRFICWQENDIEFDFSQSITSNHYLDAKYELIEYTIDYTCDIDVYNDNKVNYNISNDDIALNPLEKEGYDFLGFYLDGEKVTSIDTNLCRDITIEIKFTKKEYKINYHNTLGSKNDNNEYIDIDSEFELKAISCEGYKFLGWFDKDDAYISKVDKNLIIEQSIDLYAKWEIIIYEISYLNTQGVENSNVTSYTILDEINLLPLEKMNYYFLGWKYNDEIINKIPLGWFGNIELEAVWEEYNKYNISFFDGDVLVSSIDLYEGETLDLSNIGKVQKEGYVFNGWYIDNEFVSSINDLDSNKKVYARYNLINYNIIYKDVLNHDNPNSYTINSDDIVLLDPIDDEKLFVGWFDNDGNKVEVISKGTTGDIVLSARWEETMYEVLYDVNGGEFVNEDILKFNHLKEDVYRMTITSVNGEFWKIYASNTFLFEQSVMENPLYSYRIGLTREENCYKVGGIFVSGESCDLSKFDYVVIVSSHNGNDYNSVKSSGVKIGDYASFVIDNSSPFEILFYEEKGIDYCLEISSIDSLFVPRRKGYTFLGWFINDKKLESMKELDSQEINKITAKWERIEGTIEEDFEELFEKLRKEIGQTISSDLTFTTFDPEYNASIKWRSNSPLISETGKVTREFGDNKMVTISLEITMRGEVRSYSLSVKVARKYKDIYDGSMIGGYNYTNNVPTEKQLQRIDILYCAFGSAGTNGKISNYSSIVSNVRNYINTAHRYGTYVIISVNTSNLATVCADPKLIEIFTDDCISLINACDLDGIDIDWETPTVQTKTNFTALMKSLYAKVKANNPEHLVTAATAGGPWQYPRFDLENSIQYIDFINLMTYDLQNSSISTYQNALYNSTRGYTLTNCSIHKSLEYYNNSNVPNNKIVVGLPFYGRKFTDTDGLGKSCVNSGSMTQKDIYNQYLKSPASGVTIGFDDECKVPYIYDKTNRTFITYENPKSIGIKSQYVHDQGLAGMMFWQRTQDYNDLLLDAMYDNKNVMKN